MKKKYLSVAVVLTLAGSLLCTSCIGSFTLSNKLLAWNNSIGDRFQNELIFFAFWVLPVYEVAALADVLVLNSIEFWSGTNPVAKNTKTIEGKNGRYLVECDGKGYNITSEKDGAVIRLDFNADEQTWSVISGDQTYPLMTFVDNNHVKMITPAGDMQLVELSKAGVLAYQQIATGAFTAQR